MITIDSQAADLKLLADTLFRRVEAPSPATSPSNGSKTVSPPTDTVVLSPQAKAALAAQSAAPQTATAPAGQAPGKVIDATTVDPGFEAVAATYTTLAQPYKPKAGDPLSARFYADWNSTFGVNGTGIPSDTNPKFLEAFRNKTLVVQDAFTVPGLNYKMDWKIIGSATGISETIHDSYNASAIPKAPGTHSFLSIDRMGAFIVTYKT